MPFIRPAGVKYFALMLDHDSLYFRLNVEAIRHMRQAIHNRFQHFVADRSGLG